MASVTIKTAAKASCSITVRYKSGPSTAAGLVSKQANANGIASWSWKVGTRTTAGSWPVLISGQGQGTAQTVVRVP
jgi:micrococcal nuclease